MGEEREVVADWVDGPVVSGLLDAARALPVDPPLAELDALAERLRAFAVGLDIGRARRATAHEPRDVLGRRADGPVLGLRRYAPGEISTVHGHPWTILVTLDGDGALERWRTPEPGVAGAPAAFVRCERTAGRPVVIREAEPHRQRTSGGALELVMLRDHSESSARTDYAPIAEDATRSDFVAAFVSAWAASDADALRPLFAEDAFLDVHVPRWRTQVEGRAQALELIAAEEFQPHYRLDAWNASPAPDGFVFELRARFTFGADEGTTEMLHRARTATPAGPITDYAVYCTGVWDDARREDFRRNGGLIRP